MPPDLAPKVSVVLLTYNHERYIREALESIAAQKTDFAIELLISEDHSTDGTRDEIARFLAGYKGEVRLFYSEANQHAAIVATRALRAARGKYVAYLDGDDYWSSDVKLQRQVDFLEAHPDCVLCHHDVGRVDESGELLRILPGLQRRASIDDLIQGNFIHSCSAMVRRSAIEDIPDWMDALPIIDWPLYLLATEHGSVGWVEGTLAHYRVHAGSVWSTASETRQWAGSLAMLAVMEEHFGSSRREVFAASRGKLTQKLLEALGREEKRGVTEIAAREREIAASQRADQSAGEARAAVAEAERRADVALGEFAYELYRIRRTTRRILAISTALGAGMVAMIALLAGILIG